MAHPVVDEDLCVGEGDCEDVCPAEPNVFEVDEKAKLFTRKPVSNVSFV